MLKYIHIQQFDSPGQAINLSTDLPQKLST